MEPKEKDLLAKGIAEFNSREFFLCHETLEELWKDYKAQDREAIQGIIQIAVGFYHLDRDNQKGALKLFERGLRRVEKFGPFWGGYDFSEVLLEVNKLEKNLSLLGARKMVLDNFAHPVIKEIEGSNDC